jgi:hypothetical protein
MNGVRRTERLGSERSERMSEEAAAKFLEDFDGTPDDCFRFRSEETLPGVWVVLVEVFNHPYWWTVGVISGYSPLRTPHRSNGPA